MNNRHLLSTPHSQSRPARCRRPFLAAACAGAVALLSGMASAQAGAPWTVITGVQRSYCNRSYAAAAASLAMRDAGFSPTPYIDPANQFVTAVNGDIKVVVTVDPVSSSTFWYAIYAASQTNSNLGPWVNAIRDRLNTVVFFDCSGATGIPVGQNPPPGGTIGISTYWQTKGMPDHCGGFNWCAQVAAQAIRDSGLTSSPVIQNSSLVVGANGDTSVAVQCTNEGSYAVMSVFASSMSSSTDAWASAISNRISGLACL